MSSRDSIKCVNIYNYTGSEGRVGELIELTSEGRRFLIEFRKLIDYVAISGWVRFTEQFTSAPKLHDKIEGAKVQRGAVSQWRSALVEMQNGKCFYDETHEMSSPDVDHVLPWSFVLEDKTWNLVLACRKCNNAKRDRLTDVGALELLCSRNEKILKGAINIEAAFRRHFAEWHSRNLSAFVKSLYDQAIADGFPRWG
jgi:hypothetical protein